MKQEETWISNFVIHSLLIFVFLSVYNASNPHCLSIDGFRRRMMMNCLTITVRIFHDSSFSLSDEAIMTSAAQIIRTQRKAKALLSCGGNIFRSSRLITLLRYKLRYVSFPFFLFAFRKWFRRRKTKELRKAKLAKRLFV